MAFLVSKAISGRDGAVTVSWDNEGISEVISFMIPPMGTETSLVSICSSKSGMPLLYWNVNLLVHPGNHFGWGNWYQEVGTACLGSLEINQKALLVP